METEKKKTHKQTQSSNIQKELCTIIKWDYLRNDKLAYI